MYSNCVNKIRTHYFHPILLQHCIHHMWKLAHSLCHSPYNAYNFQTSYSFLQTKDFHVQITLQKHQYPLMENWEEVHQLQNIYTVFIFIHLFENFIPLFQYIIKIWRFPKTNAFNWWENNGKIYIGRALLSSRVASISNISLVMWCLCYFSYCKWSWTWVTFNTTFTSKISEYDWTVM